MSDDEKQVDDDNKLEIIATILGEKLRLILPSMGWTFDEALEASDATGGLGTDEILERAMAGDPRAWLAILRVSYMRAKRTFPADEIGGVNMKALTEALNDKADELFQAENTGPPTSPSGNESSESGELSENEPEEVPASA